MRNEKIEQFNSFIEQEWIPKIKKTFSHGKDTIVATCETGDAVITFAHGQKGELLVLSLWDAFLKDFYLYYSENKGKIYWRKYPEIIKEEDKYKIYARLFIAQK